MSGLHPLYHPSDDEIMREILLRISPWECSPYLLRRVSPTFMRFYSSRAIWLNIWTLHLSGPAQPGEVSMEQARRHCGLALRQPWEHLIQGGTLQAFRGSGWTALEIRDGSVKSLPEQLGEFTSLQQLNLSGCRSLKALPRGVFPTPLFPALPLPFLGMNCA